MGVSSPDQRVAAPGIARVDLLVGVVVAPFAIAEHVNEHPWWLLTAVVLTMVAALALNRRWPWGTLLVPLAFYVVYPNALWVSAVIALRIGQRGDRAGPPVMVAGALLAATAGYLVWATDVVTLQLLSSIPLLLVVPWAVGDFLRRRQQLEHRERDGIAARVRLRERERIAHDMHDSIGHEIGLIALRAGALEVAPRLTPEEAHAAAVDLRSGAVRAAERLREVIGVLRHDTHTAGPRESIADLVDHAQRSGMAVHRDTEGDPEAIPDLVERAAHRVVQEALTNATKHAPGAEVAVRVRHTDSATTVTVTNGAPDENQHAHHTGNGEGLEGVRERVRLTGGSFSAASTGQGFEVSAHLPHAAAPAPTADTPALGTGEPMPAHLAGQERHRLRRDFVRTVVVTVTICLTVAGIAMLNGW